MLGGAEMKRKPSQKTYKEIDDFPAGGITAEMIADSYLSINHMEARRMLQTKEIPSYKVGKVTYTTRDLLKIHFHGAIPEKVCVGE
jgi:hypothetical protein